MTKIENVEVGECPYCQDLCFVILYVNDKQVMFTKKAYRFSCKVRICEECFKNAIISQFGEKDGELVYSAKLHEKDDCK